MSLINDALKRANEHKPKQNSPTEISAELQAVTTPLDQAKLWPIGLFAACLVGSLWCAWMWWHGAGTETATDMIDGPTEVAARSPTSPETSPAMPEADSENYAVQDLPKIARPAPAPLPPPPAASSARFTAPPPALPAAPPAPAVALTRTLPPVQAATTQTPPPPLAAAPAQTTFPALALQGIYYRPTRPAAVINARTVYVGDRVANAKILAIDRHEVTVQWKSEVRVLAFK